MGNSSLGSEIASVTHQHLVKNNIAAADDSENLESATGKRVSGCNTQEGTFKSNTGEDNYSMDLNQATVLNEISNVYIQKCSVENKLDEADDPMDSYLTTDQKIS